VKWNSQPEAGLKVDLQGLHDELGVTAVGAIIQNNAEFADVIGGRE
jgi:hypothetical protein